MEIKDKESLLADLDEGWDALERLLETSDDKDLGERRDTAGWSVQDHLDHCAAWEDGFAALLEGKPRYEAMGVDLETVQRVSEDELNQIIRERTGPRSIEETRAALRVARDHLLAALAPLSDADLRKPYSEYQPAEPGEDDGRPILVRIAPNSSDHIREHLEWMRAILA